MGRQGVTDDQAAFSGGLNSVSDPAFLGPDQARQMGNFRLSNYGAALKRLGTQVVHTTQLAPFNSPTVGFCNGIYWPRYSTIYVTGPGPQPTDISLFSTTYGAFPRTWTNIGAVPQYRPVIFTDNVAPEVMYLAGDNTRPIYKAVPAFDTITVDATSGANNTTGASTFSWTHTFGTGTNRVLVVTAATNGADVASIVVDPTGLNVPLTLFTRYHPTGFTSRAEVWYLIAPPQTGALTIKITYATTPTARVADSITLFGVDQTNPFSAVSPKTNSSTTGQPSTIISSAATEYVIDTARDDNNADTLAAAAGQTNMSGAGGGGGGGSYKVGATSSTMAWTGAATKWVQAVVTVQRARSALPLIITPLAAPAPTVSGLCLYNGRMWGWNSINHPNSLYFSNLSATIGSTAGDSIGDPSQQGGEIVVQTFGLAAIVACAPVNGSLVIWHQRGISVLTGWGQDDTEVKPQALNAEVGMSSGTPDGVCVANELSTGDLAYFVTDLGIYKTNGGIVLPLGTPEKPDPTAALLAARVTNPSMFVLRFNRQYNELWVGIISVGIYIYNITLGSWSGPFTGTYAEGIRNFFDVVDPDGNAHFWKIALNETNLQGMFVSECDRAGVYKDDVLADGTGGRTITGTLQLRRMFGKDRVFSKSWRWLNLLATLTQGATPPVITSTTPIGGTNTQSLTNVVGVEFPYYVSPGGTGPWIDVTITDSGSTGPSQYALASVFGNMLGQR